MDRSYRRTLWLAALCCALFSTVGCADADSVSSGDDQYVTQAAGVFEIFEGIDGQYYFHLLAGNGEKVLQSEGYVSRAGAENGIESVKTNGVDLSNYDLLEAADGDWYFNLIAQNHEIIATSETYVSRSNGTRAMDTVQRLIVQNLRVEAAQTGGARFQLFAGTDGQYYFRLRAGNGEIVLQSEGYQQKAGALNGIEAVRENGKEPDQYEIIEANNGQYYFRIKAKNYEIIARSEMYASEYNAERGVQTVSDLLTSEKVADPE